VSQPPNFNRLATAYRWMEFLSFGPWLALTRRTFLFTIANCRCALILGDGDGRFSASLLHANPAITLLAVDGSQAMLRALLRRAGPLGIRVHTEQADIRDWQPPILTRDSLHPQVSPTQTVRPPFDLVVTHFFLDCLNNNEVLALALKIRRVVTPGALWLVSEFAIPPGWFGRCFARPLIACLYAAFGLLTGLAVCRLPDHTSALHKAGFKLRERRTRLAGLLIAELWTVADLP
jgi:ubiquinone/menaquinone biosynthesis C-methylase UbiE